MQNKYDWKNKKIAFFGTPSFTIEFLELFKNLGLNISLIVTSEDKPAGRGMQMKSPAPKIFAKENSIKFLQPSKLSEIEIELQNFDLFIVIAYGKIIPEKIVNLPKFGTINLHYSLLPKYRGASPVESAILNGEAESGITIQQMVYKLDAGNILYQEKIGIGENETVSELRNRMNKKALDIFPEFLEKFFNEEVENLAQDETLATSCGKFSKEDLNVTKDLQEKDLQTVFRKYKAFDKKIYFFHTKTNGTLLRVKITEMKYTGSTGVEIIRVLPESRREISYQEFLKNY